MSISDEIFESIKSLLNLKANAKHTHDAKDVISDVDDIRSNASIGAGLKTKVDALTNVATSTIDDSLQIKDNKIGISEDYLVELINDAETGGANSTEFEELSQQVIDNENAILQAVKDAGQTVEFGNTDASKILSAMANIESRLNQKEGIDSQGDGWIRYTSGLQICWGYSTVIPTEGTKVNLHVPYVNTYSIALTKSESGSAETIFTTYSITPSSFVIRQNTSIDRGSWWIAIGRWK